MKVNVLFAVKEGHRIAEHGNLGNVVIGALDDLVVEPELVTKLLLVVGRGIVTAKEIEPPHRASVSDHVADLTAKHVFEIREIVDPLTENNSVFKRISRQLGAVVHLVEIELTVKSERIQGKLIRAYAVNIAVMLIGCRRIDHINIGTFKYPLIAVGQPQILIFRGHMSIPAEHTKRLFMAKRLLSLGGKIADHVRMKTAGKLQIFQLVAVG